MDDIITNPHKEPRLSELLDIFPEAIPIVKRNLRLYRKEYRKAEEKQKAIMKDLLVRLYKNKNLTEKEKLFWEIFIEGYFYHRPLQFYKRQIPWLEKLLRMHEWRRKPKDNSAISDADIVRAKDVPVTDFVEVNMHGFAKCPFHNEKTPSFKVYSDNRFHCFGCGMDGDVIDFIMKSEGVDFVNAVRMLVKK